MNKFDLSIQQFGQPVSHTELDLVTVLKLLSREYEAGTIGYLTTMDDSLASEIVSQLRLVDEYWSTQVVAQRLIGKVWSRPVREFGLPVE